MSGTEPLVGTARTGIDAARFSAWASAWLAGLVPYDDAVSAITRERLHQVYGLPRSEEPVPVGWALTALRTCGADAVRLALPVPGDLAGLPGPEPLRRAGLEAGSAAVAAAYGLALVPTREQHGNDAEGQTVSVRWTVLAADPASPSLYLSLREADQQLSQALRDSTDSLAALEVARWRPELAEALTDLRRTARSGTDEGSWLPPGYPVRARLLLTRAAQLGRVVALASADDPGGAISGGQALARREALAELDRAVRQARLSAYNCFGVEPE